MRHGVSEAGDFDAAADFPLRARTTLKKRALLTVAACLLLAGSGVGSTALGGGAASADANWTNTGGPVDESGYSRLDQINKANVGKLGLAWALDLDNNVSLEGTPLAVDGVLYFAGSYCVVYAVDAVSGKVLWTYDPKIWQRSPGKFRSNFGANRGVAYADGRIFLGALDGHLTALNAKTGAVEWDVQTVPEKSIHTITGRRGCSGAR